MKNNIVLFLCSILLFSRSADDDSESPILNITGIFVNDDTNNYARIPDQIPTLAVGDEVHVSFSLDGNGSDLRTFVLKNDFSSNIKTTFFFEIDDISSELTDIKEGILAFNDIRQTWVTVVAKIISFPEDDPSLSFYLSSKAVNSEGATRRLNLILNRNPENQD